jgi:hypothetical protein
MRDRDENVLEFIDAFEKDDHFFVVVELRSRRFQFGVSRLGYLAVRNAMQLRPFDTMPGVKYRYFYGGSSREGFEGANFVMGVRVESGRDAKTEEITIPQDLHANLLWFDRLEDLNDAAYLEVNRLER